ncbi:helix-turn-helix transcriptional regulator [Actinoplanes sp. NPDC049598]|uniref:helix-turn-helix domain-containing protein n=1 Tax=Actinoplanes sp. NPDC049598 TaxID=3154626 RepID=UPI003415CB22
MITPPPPADLPALGRAVAKARERAGLTLDGLAEASGVSRRMLVEVEAGRINCTVGVLHAISHGVGVALPDLVRAACPHLDNSAA